MIIGIAQINTRAGDFAATVARMEEISRSAREQGVELLLFPYAALTGPQPVEYASQEGNLLDLSDALVSLSDGVACPCVVPVVTEMEGGTFTEAMLLQNGEVMPLRLLSYASGASGREPNRMSERQEVFAPSTFEFGGYRFGLGFAYDDIDALVRAEQTIDALLFFSGYGYALDDAGSAMGAALGENRFRADAGALDAWLVGVSSLGGYGTQVFTGSSFVLAPQGDLVASAPAFEEALLVAQLDIGRSAPAENSGPSSFEPEIYNRSLHLWETLSLGLHDYLSKLGYTDAALVLDGSLPADLLMALASDAIGPQHVHALVCGKQANARTDAARTLAGALRVDVVEVSLANLGDDADDLLRADLSRAYLASYARSMGAFPLSGEDKTYLALEASVATCRAAALLPFGDVYRTDLIELAHMRNTISPVLPPAAFGAFSVPMVAGLDDAEATPEMRLQRLDVTLVTHVEWERGLSDVVARQGNDELTAEILRVLRLHEEARRACAPCLVVSSRTLHDARMPVGYAWLDRVRSEDERVSGSETMERITSLLDPTNNQGERASDMESLLKELDVEAISSMPLPEGVDRRAMERSISDLLGLLQDLLQSGGLTLERPEGGNPPFDGPLGPLTWGSPFSEN